MISLLTRLVPPRTSLAVRLALASACVGLAIGSIAIAISYVALSRQLSERVELELDGKQSLVLHFLSEIDSASALGQQLHRFGDLFVGHDDLHLVIAGVGTNEILASFSSLAVESAQLLTTQADAKSLIDWHSRQGTALTALVRQGSFANGEQVQFVLSQERANDQMLLRGLIDGALIGLPLLMALIIAGAWVVGRTGLAPLVRFEKLARASSAVSLAHRLELDDLPKDLQDLAKAFNAMLDRIDEGVLRLTRVAGDLAHEMRTPIATLIGLSQVTLSQPRTADDLRSVIERNIEELERLSRLIADMLFLAHAEDEGQALRKEPANLRDEANRIKDYMSVVADERGIAIEVSGNASVLAERVLVQRAITNLISNAIRHALPGSTIRIEIAAQTDSATLSVINAGSVIAAEHIPHLFERFYRADTGRSRHDGGTGLGLSIVKAIMTLHGGTVEVASTPDTATGGDTRFKLTFFRLGSQKARGVPASQCEICS